MADMTKDFFADTPYGELGLKKMAARKPLPENFRLFEAGYVEQRVEDFNTLLIKGAQFRAAKTGPNKGKLSIMVEGTEREACVTLDEMKEHDDAR